MNLPESRHKYLYERLGDHDFQQLVGTLLTHQFENFVPMPLRQADGGRDGVDPSHQLVYQVKWSADGKEKDPVAWLDAEVRKESEKIKAQAASGVRRWVLVTNVPGTGKPKSGTIDRLNEKLYAYAQQYGLEMSCIWREALNAMVDSAPVEVKWAYAEMLAGWDLIRYLVQESVAVSKDAGLRDLLRTVAVTQGDNDARIKFSQVELDREYLSDLFVDVAAELVHVPEQVRSLVHRSGELGGAAAYISKKDSYPFTLVRGAPGQGKSTLGQFVCQTYRRPFLPTDSEDPATSSLADQPRFPIRVDLAEYAAWRQGYDVFESADDGEVRKRRRRAAAKATVEGYLAEMIGHLSGRSDITTGEVQDIFHRVPILVVFDGLDEVGSSGDRQRVVREIDLFCARGRVYAVTPKVVVTTRPNSAGLAEPNPDVFEVISLIPLDAALRDQYLRKWCTAHGVRGSDSRVLRRNFTEKTREPYIGELAGNPMQLTILLYLLRQHGDATPNQRTELYDAYMNLLLAREANKYPDSVRKHRSDLMEVVPFLGWYIQSRAEEDGHSGRMSQADVDAAMKHFQTAYGKSLDVVDELLEAASDRLWALTSKEEGTFEFEVVSLREYFAARFLYKYAGEGDPRFDRTKVFRELLRRPFWLNTVRFYGGNAVGSDIYVLKSGIEHELAEGASKHVRAAAWSLVTDGVFSSRPQEASVIIDLLTDHEGSTLLLEALDEKQIVPLPEGSNTTRAWERITTQIAAHPGDPHNLWRVRIIRELFGLKSAFALWWEDQLTCSIGTDLEKSWLEIGASCEVAADQKVSIPGISAEDGQTAQLILNTGMVPDANSSLEHQLFRSVLDGQCSETTSVRSEPAQLAVALSPTGFYSFGGDSILKSQPLSFDGLRSRAIQLLQRRKSPYVRIARLRRFKQGEKGSTFPWANTAAALHARVGRRWLVSEIAVIGAASPLLDGYTVAVGTEALGSAGHPVTLIEETRANRANADWWRERRERCNDDLSKAEWAFALWSVAEKRVIDELFEELRETAEQLAPPYDRAFRIAARRMAQSGLLDSQPLSSRETTGALAQLLDARERGAIKRDVPVKGKRDSNDVAEKTALSLVAKRAKWLKVDQIATYR